MRESGMLLHMTSLPEKGGIGTMGQAAYDFIDFLKAAGMSIWQMLPVGPTGFGESPYQSASTFAGNPLLIDLAFLERDGLLPPGSFEPLPDGMRVDFEAVRKQKEALLRLAFDHADVFEELQSFVRSQPWVEEYGLFMALKAHFGGGSWQAWPEEVRLREPHALRFWREKLKKEIEFHIFVQWIFDAQWEALHQYAASQGIQLFGDMPIYVAEDSADTWGHPENFQLDKSRRPIQVAGVPPDYFSEDGQLWGNPLYHWGRLRRQHYGWWLERLKAMGKRFDLVRVDHFIGFANYYSIPYGAPNARKGKWRLGPGKGFFRAVKKKAPEVHIIAEDLGEVNNRVKRLLRYCGFPGMKVLTFAFGGGEENPHLPVFHGENAVVYTGTHDNDTALGWWQGADEKTRRHAEKVLGEQVKADPAGALIAAAFHSTAQRAMIPMQDFLRLGSEARMNTPGTIGGQNWAWRMEEAPGEDILNEIRALNQSSHRGGNAQ